MFCFAYIMGLPGTASAFDMEFATVDNHDEALRVILQFEAESTLREQQSIFENYHLVSINTLLPNTYLVSARKSLKLSDLYAEPAVLYAEPDYIYSSFSSSTTESVIPDDTRYIEQWGLEQINAPDAWAMTTGSSDVVIAVIDTGVDSTHPDLAGQLVTGAVTLRRSRNIEDSVGHGTHVASTIAGRTNNQEGIAGVAWGARIMPVKALNWRGSGNISDVARGIRWAVDNGADIINMSLGGSDNSNTFKSAIDYADEHDVLVIAAVGNEYADGSPVSYPAAYDNVLSVAATDKDDNPASFSSSGDYIDVAAPGVDILAATSRLFGWSYISFEGTSMATPFVSGLAALLLSIDPDLSNQELMDLITSTAVDVGAEGWDDRTGYGRVDAAAALAALAPTPVSDSQTILNLIYLPIIMQADEATVNAASLPQQDNGSQIYLPIIIR